MVKGGRQDSKALLLPHFSDVEDTSVTGIGNKGQSLTVRDKAVAMAMGGRGGGGHSTTSRIVPSEVSYESNDIHSNKRRQPSCKMLHNT